jgi:hypothetical protein
MTPQVSQAAIFLPLMAIVALTVFGFLRLMVLRIRTTKERAVKLSYYRAFQGDAEPEGTAVAARHYNNLFEAPVLFYAACIVAFELGSVTRGVLFLAWAYVAARYAQSAIHLTSNNVRHRALAFLLGWVLLVALWVRLGTALAGQL